MSSDLRCDSAALPRGVYPEVRCVRPARHAVEELCEGFTVVDSIDGRRMAARLLWRDAERV